ncbi:MAG: hypothetical protein ACLP59_12955 [Bryobacteraceae bacterium]
MTHLRGTRDDLKDVNIDERLEALTQSLELLAHMHADTDARQIAADERARAADERARAADERARAAEERHNREMEDIRRLERATRSDLRRAFAMGVREARNARRRRQELDEKITQLAAAQLVTEEKLQLFIESLRRGTNGRSQQ